MNAVIYARYSSDNQREESIEGQIRECLEFAEKNHYKVVAQYIDRALSARTADRPEFQKMISDSEKGLFDIVLVWKLDRFSRDRYDSAFYKHALRKNGVRIVSAKENITDTPEGIILESMLEGMAEYYSAELSVKVKRGLTENALKCRFNGGFVPYGYTVDTKDRTLKIDPLTAPIVREIFNRIDKGERTQQIKDSLNERGIKTNFGKPFTYSKVGHMLRNRLYIGEYRFKDIVVPDGVPAIIDKEQFERIQRRMKTYQKATGKAKAHEEYLLTPKLFCGTCGNLMVGECGTSRNKVTKHYYYKCSGAKHNECTRKKGLKKDWIEKLVSIVTLESVLNDEVIDRIADAMVVLQNKKDTVVPAMMKQLADCEKSIENMVNAIQAGALTSSTTQRLKDLENEKEKLNAAIIEAKLQRPKFEKEYVIQGIKGFQYGDFDNKEYQRRIIDTFVNSVYVYDDRIVFNYNFKDGSVSLPFDEINNTFGSYLETVAPPLDSEPNIVVTLTTFGFAVSMEDLEELYERHCGRTH